MPAPRLSSSDSGASSVEYGMLVAAIAGVVVVILLALGAHVSRLFDHSCDSVQAKAAPASSCE